MRPTTANAPGGTAHGRNTISSAIHGHGWHLARGTFDLWLRDEARRRGAALLASATVAGITPENGGWRVRLQTRHGPCDAAARIVIDATGRSARLARGIGARRQRGDRLVSVWQYGHDDDTARGFAHIGLRIRWCTARPARQRRCWPAKVRTACQRRLSERMAGSGGAPAAATESAGAARHAADTLAMARRASASWTPRRTRGFASATRPGFDRCRRKASSTPCIRAWPRPRQPTARCRANCKPVKTTMGNWPPSARRTNATWHIATARKRAGRWRPSGTGAGRCRPARASWR